MANFFSTSFGKALTGIVGKVAGAYVGPVAEAAVGAGAGLIEAHSLERKAKKAERRMGAIVRPQVLPTSTRALSVPALYTRSTTASKAVRDVLARPWKSISPPSRLSAPIAPSAAMVRTMGSSFLPQAVGGIELARAGVEFMGEHPSERFIRAAEQRQIAAPRTMATNRLSTFFAGNGFVGPTLRQASTRRTMNPANIKALRRAARRLESFVKIAKRFIRIEKQVKMKKTRRRC